VARKRFNILLNGGKPFCIILSVAEIRTHAHRLESFGYRYSNKQECILHYAWVGGGPLNTIICIKGARQILYSSSNSRYYVKREKSLSYCYEQARTQYHCRSFRMCYVLTFNDGFTFVNYPLYAVVKSQISIEITVHLH